MDEPIKIIECPRDAWQGLPGIIPAEMKAAYLRRLVSTGFRHIDAASFVSPAAVPQMADSERVLELLGPVENVEIIGIVVNEKGAERAIRTGAVHTLGFPFSVSPQFLRRNQHQTPEESLHVLQSIMKLACDAQLGAVVYVSMAFGNPYEDPWSAREVVAACGQLIDLGFTQISLADTAGSATPERIAETVSAVCSAFDRVEIGVHLHAPRSEAPERIRAAFHAGIRRFDAAIGGLGGCPFAQDALVGNIPTESLIATLAGCGATVPALAHFEDLMQASAEIEQGFGTVER
ncbi:MAG TPA: hydroxymethylglutaryl-CoA lyase [Terracidiphilus sp.]|jgi:hydroxymethylglutaryl-CoA lyase|nr:hydroxymethylglutaryl-CoA lyase [Terracidiphilus sp.]